MLPSIDITLSVVDFYFSYIFLVKWIVRFILDEKKCKSPKDFCTEISSGGQTSMNPSYEHNQYTGKGASRQVFVPLDGEGQFIDLNLPYDDGNMNINNDEDLGQIQNAEGSVNLDLKL